MRERIPTAPAPAARSAHGLQSKQARSVPPARFLPTHRSGVRARGTRSARVREPTERKTERSDLVRPGLVWDIGTERAGQRPPLYTSSPMETLGSRPVRSVCLQIILVFARILCSGVFCLKWSLLVLVTAAGGLSARMMCEFSKLLGFINFATSEGFNNARFACSAVRFDLLVYEFCIVLNELIDLQVPASKPVSSFIGRK